MKSAPSGSLGDIGDRDDIETLVRDFYRDAATDDLLGPIFEAAHVDWPSHIATLTNFWAWQLLGERGYDGNPLRAHEPVHEACPFADAHFGRWLDLFTGTVDTNFAGPTADAAKQRAGKMARALARLLRGEHGGRHEPTEPFQPMGASSASRPPRSASAVPTT